MKTTLDIPDQLLEDVMKNTGAKTKREAVLTALREYNRRKKIASILNKLGTFEGFISVEELIKLREMD